MVFWTMKQGPISNECGHTIIRIGIGIVFMIFGYSKLVSGSAHVTEIGSAVSLLGITYFYMWWGYLAALTEFFGGIAYIIGFGTRIVSLPLIGLLIVAMRFHFSRGDAFTTWGFAFSLLIVAIGLLVAGSGKYSLDYFLIKK